MHRHPHLASVKVCEQEFHNNLTLAITLDIEPPLLAAIRQRLWWYKCAYKHKTVFDMGPCWRGFKKYAQCGLEFPPGDVAWVSACYLCKNTCLRRSARCIFFKSSSGQYLIWNWCFTLTRYVLKRALASKPCLPVPPTCHAFSPLQRPVPQY
jgi:hypothetical protein